MSIKLINIAGIIIEFIGVFILSVNDLFGNFEKYYTIIRNSVGTRGMSRDPNVNSMLGEMLKRTFYTRIGFIIVFIGVIIQLFVQFFD